ncbi:hypothetical protein GGX14DRAFT_651852 [Mycena pura]|uniref:Cytochrome P450 n=1 Tax=Mycena pura TaxID=153505 RepID=A0AAD6V6N1_9AGAR|nr:hypothetical protein GGX14DRAFT_651852 [Mycena pura]
MLNGTVSLATLAVLYTAARIAKRARASALLPRVGRAGPPGYAWAVLRSVLDSEGLVEEACAQFGGRPFVLPSMSGEWVVLGPENVELLRRSDLQRAGARMPPADVDKIRAEIRAAVARGGQRQQRRGGPLLPARLAAEGDRSRARALRRCFCAILIFFYGAAGGTRRRARAAAAALQRGGVPRPRAFDAFRFARLRADGGARAQHAFTALSNDYIVFRLGKHGCPGCLFAALNIKVILAELLLHYDVAFPAGASRAPKPFAFNIFTVPNPTAELMFTRRETDAAE